MAKSWTGWSMSATNNSEREPDQPLSRRVVQFMSALGLS